MSTHSVALDHYRRQARSARTLEREAARRWRQVDRADIARSWVLLMPGLLVALIAAQREAAGAAEQYVAAALAEQSITADRVRVNVDAFAGIASDGRDLASLLLQPIVTSKVALAAGASPARALASGQAALRMIVGTQVADAGRVAEGVVLAGQRGASGYVRMTVGKTCSRCLVLAGKRFEWNAGFRRHPRCDCRHVPVGEDVPGDVRTNPKAAFAAMTRAEQDKTFTKAGAQAIRDGADMNQIVNARKGANGLTPAGARITAAEARILRGGRDRGRLQTRAVFGRELFTTTEAVTTRGRAGVLLGAKETGQKTGGRYRTAKGVRLMPESIYQIADGDRTEALRLLSRYGYIL